MKRLLKVAGIIVIIVIILLILLILQVIRDRKIQEEDQASMVKADADLLGAHLYIQREGSDDVDVNFYLNPSGEKLPLVINLHGGAFVAGDADTLDTQSDRISKSWSVHVATINYKLLEAGISKEYVLEEIEDTVQFFVENQDTYHIDTDNVFILGYSAGGYYAMASALALRRSGVSIRGQILCYAFLGDILEQYQDLTDEQKGTMPPALFVLADGDPLGEASLEYQNVLEACGISTRLEMYQGVRHGFIEENNPEYEQLHSKNRTSKSPEAEQIARKAEDTIGAWIAETIQ